MLTGRSYSELLSILGEKDPEVTRLIDILFQRFLPRTVFAKELSHDKQRLTPIYFLQAGPVDQNFGDFKHIRNWIKAAIANSENWIGKTDHRRVPLRFLSIKNYWDLLGQIKDDEEKNRQDLTALFKSKAQWRPSREELVARGDVEIVHEFNDSMCFVRDRTPFALDRDGHFIKNCIGYGAYDINLTWPGYEYYSLWDARDEPHVSMEVIDGMVNECQGKQNLPPAAQYMPYVIEFVTSQEWSVHPDSSRTGIVDKCNRNSGHQAHRFRFPA